MVWPTLGSRTAKEQEQDWVYDSSHYNRTTVSLDQGLLLSARVRVRVRPHRSTGLGFS